MVHKDCLNKTMVAETLIGMATPRRNDQISKYIKDNSLLGRRVTQLGGWLWLKS